ncbi:MAG: type IV pilus modification PilV family protein [Phycisphaerales bacterium]
MNNRRRGRRARAGLTMIEVVLSFIVVSLMLLAALEVVAASRKTIAIAERRATARFLADELLTVVFSKPYADPNETPVFGLDASESLATKISFDDVDDFNGWNEAPPLTATEKKMTDYAGWSREVTVEWVLASAPTTVQASETNAKRITVIAKYQGMEYGRAVAVRTNAPTPKAP